jgi:hypothetical protein
MSSFLITLSQAGSEMNEKMERFSRRCRCPTERGRDPTSKKKEREFAAYFYSNCVLLLDQRCMSAELSAWLAHKDWSHKFS